MKHRSRLDALTAAVHRWLELPKTSRSTITAEIVEAVDRLGITEALAREGITFARTDDLYNDARVNAQKLFRWLGQYEGQHAFPDRLFHVEPAILAAMPEQLRLDYLAEVYGSAGVVVSARHQGEDDIDPRNMAAILTKEQSEALLAVINLGNQASEEQAEHAHRELMEAAAAAAAAGRQLEKAFPGLAVGAQGKH